MDKPENNCPYYNRQTTPLNKVRYEYSAHAVSWSADNYCIAFCKSKGNTIMKPATTAHTFIEFAGR